MEGVGVAEAVEKYNALETTARKIAYTNVRTASNVIHHPVTQVRRARISVSRAGCHGLRLLHAHPCPLHTRTTGWVCEGSGHMPTGLGRARRQSGNSG